MNKDLVERAMKKDNDAITTLFLDMQKELYAISKTRLRNEDDINDAIQDTILCVYKNIQKLKHAEFFKTWVIRILINNCNAIYRKRMIFNTFQDFIDVSAEKRYNKVETISTIDEKIDFFNLINKLNYDERQLLTLFYYNKYTTKQISEILNKNENTIRTQIHRAKKKLKKIYKEDFI